ncbi:tRNA pseudouridine(55) synthase TruB [Staphylococcus simiae]|uniref:tRNA pseudouridine(55) synthase TruB n=1 Tax=Staphylococcus simiae TaxID=308354 RepID=UPI001A964C2F|nr:tRNA pseudouridine(55) synthase TruB [Staphylococcus simiae]MBO1198980.1 tRNA pseudouridine(55) synthase TruB [Staphylococcus simiae]MBO1201247.1 tRNA pseudouridine(55) synthase TruB [Staphylococcus simiae]MBO1203396.1 tRNA pseudouridine(55) synthase TruB [Staphylococcus simiae]MBO1210938.1 tRNA pseudouridine(55) synthase TruB [Staphylococcus simiae]MBO1229600.1 tRNA pseudouridine(55) synthase TruB [Staphylococcus simiae]
MYNGILPVYKERGLTSHDVVFKLRKILKTKKIGHTGTLDPEVDGVLPICIGPATRISDYVMDMGKSYVATVTIGRSTTTEDQTGVTIAQSNVNDGQITVDQVDKVLQHFQGHISQTPPMYSSVKVNGKKLYEYARNNETVERPTRTVIIYNIKRISELNFTNNECNFDITVTCGKGTYIRTLATDIGKALELPAHMSKLTRIESGGFKLEDSLSLEDIKALHEHDSLQTKLFPIEYGLKGLSQIIIEDPQVKQRILNGQKFYTRQFKQQFNEQVVFIDHSTKKALAIYIIHPDKPAEIKPKKVFN